MHADCLTPKPLGVTFVKPSITFFITQQVPLIHPHTGMEDTIKRNKLKTFSSVTVVNYFVVI